MWNRTVDSQGLFIIFLCFSMESVSSNSVYKCRTDWYTELNSFIYENSSLDAVLIEQQKRLFSPVQIQLFHTRHVTTSNVS
jgi:hypothetical protein